MGEAQALTAESEDQILKEAETLATQGQWRKAALLATSLDRRGVCWVFDGTGCGCGIVRRGQPSIH